MPCFPPGLRLNSFRLDHICPIWLDGFCRECLNEEYAVLCRKLAGKLSRKRPSPLGGGAPNGWAAGIVRTIAWSIFSMTRARTHT